MKNLSQLIYIAAISAAVSCPLHAQEWQLVDTFDGGVPQGNWTQIGTPVVDTASGFLDLRISDAGPANSTVMAELPVSFSSGTFTIAFDYYLPVGELANETGFGVASPAMMSMASWAPIGSDNRFQTVNAYPQNMTKVPNWSLDIFGTTEQGVWYNVWLVYDLSASPQTVTSVTKKASDPMVPESLTTVAFDFSDRGNGDDWSEITHFGYGIGFLGNPPEGFAIDDTLGALADNIYVSSDENLTEKPTSIGPDWAKVDTFADGGPEATWTVDSALSPTFDGDALTITGTAPNAGMYVALPYGSLRSSFTVTFDLLLPAGAGGNDVQFAVVGEEQIAQTGTALFGGNDRFVTQPGQDPQPLARFGEWPSIGGPDLLGGTVEDQWYHVWVVYDGSDRSMNFYSVPVSDPVESVTIPSEPAGTFTMATDYTSLGYFVIGTGFLANGNGITIDNLYQSLGTNVTLSPTAGDLGSGGGGDPVSLWAELPDIGGGFKASGIGLINDANYPFVWHLPSNGYLYISDEYSDLTNIWGMDLSNDFWFWSQEDAGGWYFNISDPASGDMGWSLWPM